MHRPQAQQGLGLNGTIPTHSTSLEKETPAAAGIGQKRSSAADKDRTTELDSTIISDSRRVTAHRRDDGRIIIHAPGTTMTLDVNEIERLARFAGNKDVIQRYPIHGT
jgi:hypothetical protein